MTELPAPTVQATRYTVSCLPEDDVNARHYEITVEYRGGGRWAVTRFSTCLGVDGTWALGIKPYDRGDDWLDAHRFDLDTALHLAKKAAPSVTVNDVTAADIARRRTDQ
ncbi:hypothetical protein [Streptomyces sp. URMC 123]|uniref:hypothetical protein n=1 Tax=Streptomyces sp. URMC 123 TaxID=3423403 RepID=UPI003F1B7B74